MAKIGTRLVMGHFVSRATRTKETIDVEHDMTVPQALDQHEWDYRNLIVGLGSGGESASGWRGSAPEFVEDLLRTVEELDASGSGGWRLVSVAGEEDPSGHCRLNARLKRARPVAAEHPETGFPATIPLRQPADDAQQGPGIKRAA
ncbi:MAG: hypothetical protein HQ567_19705 [Candidatus Nealsonbacteria bacterium]|nr:hypothetical protein [Candidatus Nealsonbacteria bacterium]